MLLLGEPYGGSQKGDGIITILPVLSFCPVETGQREPQTAAEYPVKDIIQSFS